MMTPLFNLVFGTVVAFTFLCLMISLFLVVHPPIPSASATDLAETCSTCFKMDFGAVVGLLGGKKL
jgi:hypothetical protein